MEINSKLSKNKIIILNVLSSFILLGIAFFTAPIFSSVLGSNNYGIVGVYTTWVSIFSTVFTLQATTTMVIARSTFPAEDQTKYQSSVLSLAVFSYSLFAVLVFIVLNGREQIIGLKQGLLLFALLQGIGQYCVNTLNGKLNYEFKADKNFILSVSVTLVNVALSLYFIHRIPVESNYLGRVYGMCITYMSFGLMAYLIIFSKGRTVYNAEYWKFTLPIAIPTIFHLLAGLLLGQSDRLMLQQLLDYSSSGIYTLAATFSSVIGAIWNALNSSWAPFFYEYMRLAQTDEMKKRAANYIELFTIIICGFILLSPEVFHIFSPDREYWIGTYFIPVFVVGHYFVFMYSFAVNYEFYNKQTKLIAKATVIAAFLTTVS